ncbi:MAG TPA: acyl carrier protein [Bryobacteraceae bacterium]|nr:acyl carrier protein [Bryobacteraceae bacterium]
MATKLDSLKTAFSDALGVAPDTKFDDLAYAKSAGWDSVAHMKLVSEIENVFDIMLDTDDVIGMSSFPVAKDIVAKYGVDLDSPQ